MKGIKVCSNCLDISSLKGGEHMSKNILIVAVVLLVGVTGYFLLSGGNTSQPNSLGVTTPQTEISQPRAEEKANTQTDFDKRFIAYSGDNLGEATKRGRAVVFFHASWCPLCSEAEADLKSNWGKVPSDVTILKTDYDSSKELKAKYGIVSQDTWVQVDESGRELAKWNSGGKGLQTLLANIK